MFSVNLMINTSSFTLIRMNIMYRFYLFRFTLIRMNIICRIYLFPFVGVNERRFPMNRNALLIIIEIRVLNARGFIAFVIDCHVFNNSRSRKTHTRIIISLLREINEIICSGVSKGQKFLRTGDRLLRSRINPPYEQIRPSSCA